MTRSARISKELGILFLCNQKTDIHRATLRYMKVQAILKIKETIGYKKLQKMGIRGCIL